MTFEEKAEGILKNIVAELVIARRHNPEKFNSPHEGYAVILEEMDELWDEIKRPKARRNYSAMAFEATQVAAMAIRFLVDICGGSP